MTLEGSSNAVEAARVELIGDRLVVSEGRKGLMGIFASMGEPLHARIRIPHGSHIDAATASADVYLEGTFAEASMASASGDLELVGALQGDADVKTATAATCACHTSAGTCR